ncbi:hypothetical protein JHK85_007309 [Glycine max]|nr:hypothetical protein JHK85_007309 [Glycine max]
MLLLLCDRIYLNLQPYRDRDNSPPYLGHPQPSIVRILQDIVKLVGLYTMQHNRDSHLLLTGSDVVLDDALFGYEPVGLLTEKLFDHHKLVMLSCGPKMLRDEWILVPRVLIA